MLRMRGFAPQQIYHVYATHVTSWSFVGIGLGRKWSITTTTDISGGREKINNDPESV